MAPASFDVASSHVEEARTTPPPPRVRRLSENRGLSLKVDTGLVEKSMYFPGCGKALLDDPASPYESGLSSLAQRRRSSLGKAGGGSSTGTLSLSSSPSVSVGDDDEEEENDQDQDSPSVERLSIVLTHTGFVEDVVTPWQANRSAEAAFFNTDGVNSVGPGFRSSSAADSPPDGAAAAGGSGGGGSGAFTPPSPTHLPQPGKVRRRVSFTDEKGGPDGDGEPRQPLVSLHLFSSERAAVDRLSTLSDRDSEGPSGGQSADQDPDSERQDGGDLPAPLSSEE